MNNIHSFGAYTLGGSAVVSLYQDPKTAKIYYENGRGQVLGYITPVSPGYVTLDGGSKQTISPVLPLQVVQNYNSKNVRTAR